MTQFRSVAEDIEWLHDEWWLGVPDSLSDGHLRRGSAALGLLLVDGLLQRAWQHYGFEGEPVIEGPDVTALAAHHGVRLEHAATLIAGGGREAGQDLVFLGLFRIDHPKTGVPADAESGFAVVQTGIQRDASSPPTPGAFDPLVNRRWPLSAYLDAPAAVRRGVSISRRDILDYFRSYVGGAGHQAVRDPAESGSPQLSGGPGLHQIIAELGGVVDANLRDGLHFELLSIGQAVGRSVDLLALAAKIRADEEKARRLAPAVRRYERPVSRDLVLSLASPDPAGGADPDAQLLGNLLGIRSPDVPIYRTFRLKDMRTMLRGGKLTLVAPRLWDDPFESILSNTVLVGTRCGGLSEPVLTNLRRPVYAQCWSLNEESDALWRIYSTVTKDRATRRNTSAPEEGIRVRTTAKRLLSALWRASPADPVESCFLGAVRYMPQREALQHIAEIVRSPADRLSSGSRQAESLLIKREPFAHEREARLIFVENRPGFGHEDLFRVPFDPNALCRHVTLDPRLGADDASERVAELRALGFAGEIVQSRLYQRVRLEVRT